MPELPARVVLRGRVYRVQETPDHTIIFTEDSPIFGFRTVLLFRKHDGGKGLWYFTGHANDRIDGGEVIAGHVEQAYALVQRWRGGNHEPWAERAATKEADRGFIWQPWPPAMPPLAPETKEDPDA
jgi:hypothetical protein